MKIFRFLCFAILGFTAFAMAAAPTREAILNWGAVTTDVEGGSISGVTYKVYRGPSSSGITGKTTIASGVTGLVYTDSGRVAGTTDCYNVTAVANNLEGGPSVEACKSYPGVAPSSVPSLTVQ